jgi:DNA-binding NarL/FixJ family response regulator
LHLVLPQSAFRAEPAPATNPLLARLTRRELEILGLMAAGSSTQAIASELCISPTTVRNHIQHTLAKLCVHGRLEAILATRTS